MQASIGSLSSSQEEKRGREAARERRGQATGEEQSASPLMGMLGGSSTNDHTWVWSWWKRSWSRWLMMSRCCFVASVARFGHQAVRVKVQVSSHSWIVIRIPDPNLCRSHSTTIHDWSQVSWWMLHHHSWLSDACMAQQSHLDWSHHGYQITGLVWLTHSPDMRQA